jgi:glutamyl-tRNA reductase
MKTLDVHQENLPLVVIGVNHHTAKVNIREKATFTEKQQTSIIKLLHKKYNTRGSLVLSTCNRTEIYICGRKAIKYIWDICNWLDSLINDSIFCNKDLVYIFKGKKVIHHFFRVITSLDSQIVGEPQITGQVKDAYENSHAINQTDILLNKMYNFGMQVEKQVRSKTYLTDGAVSVSFAAVELARKIFGDLINTTVLLIGAGETVELASLHFAKRNVARIWVANRTFKKAQYLADKFQGEPLALENLEQAFEQADIVLTATSSDFYIVEKQLVESAAKKRNYKPIFLIDLAIPRNIDPAVADTDGVFLYNLDGLQEIVQKNIEQRKKEIPKAEKIVENHVTAYIKWYKTLPVIKTIMELSHYFEEIREQEFERLKNRFPEEIQGDAEYLSKSLMKKFLHQHIVMLRRSNEDPQKQKQHIDLVGDIYRLNGSKVEKSEEN